MAIDRPAFSAFERRIDAIREAHPAMPRAAVLRVRLMHHVLRLLADDLEQFFGAHGISASAWSALMMIYSSPQARANPSALSADLVQSRTHMTRVADELVAKGLVSREANSADRRRIDLVLSPRGRAFIDRVSPRAWKHYEDVLSAFDAGEARALERLLRKLQPHLAALSGRPAGAAQ